MQTINSNAEILNTNHTPEDSFATQNGTETSVKYGTMNGGYSGNEDIGNETSRDGGAAENDENVHDTHM